MSDYFGKEVPKLGFGFMRLPHLEDGSVDIEQTKKMVDIFMDAGLTYFDTAFVYDNGKSEEALKTALVDRYPRESFTICTKLCAWYNNCNEEQAKEQFDISLKRTGAGYFDYYLLHALQSNNYKAYEDKHLWEFVKAKKEAGLIKHYGFSYHADAKLLDELLTQHPDVDFIQLQLNYADWENKDVQSRECYEVARKHNKSIVVMEPVKGGLLATTPEKIHDLFKANEPELSDASWAIRFVASLDGIITVLSGMSNIEQVEDNTSYMKNFKPFGDKEFEVIKQAQKILSEQKSIPCTKCRYCVNGCPQKIIIPEILAVRNELYKFNNLQAAKGDYGWATKSGAKASACIKCRKCEKTCPQHLPITDLLKDCAEIFEA